jgi:hypothetical protein
MALEASASGGGACSPIHVYTAFKVASKFPRALKFPKLLIEELTSTKFGSNLIKLRRKTEFDQISKQARSENLGLTCVKSVHGHLS